MISVQQRMNEMSLEKEQQIEPLRNILLEMYVNLSNKNSYTNFFIIISYEYSKRFDQFENTFDQVNSMIIFIII